MIEPVSDLPKESGTVLPEWRTFLEGYFSAYFTERNSGKTLAFLDPGITGFGTGLDELGRKPDELWDLYLRDLEGMQAPISYGLDWVEGRALGLGHALVFCVLSIRAETQEGPIDFDNLRFSLVIEKGAQGWKMVHHHLSEPTGRQEAGESFPLKELRVFNERLVEEVRLKTAELGARNEALEKLLAEVRTLTGLIPICASCKKIRDDSGYWNEVEEYLQAHSEAEFTHGLCPTCIPTYFPDAKKALL